jgi:hypothetical protein
MESVILFVVLFLIGWGIVEVIPLIFGVPGAEATYIDRSGSMSVAAGSVIPTEGQVYWFDIVVYGDNPNFTRGGTLYQCVIDHARKHKYKHIRVVTDGWGEDVDTTGLKVDWYFVED